MNEPMNPFGNTSPREASMFRHNTTERRGCAEFCAH
jgi:hypothetical protein